MKLTKTLSTLTLTAAISTLTFANIGHAEEKAQIQWLPISQVASQIEATGVSQIHEIERSRMGYKVEAINTEGKRTKIIVNGETGEIIKQVETNKNGKRNKADRQQHKHMKNMQHKKHSRNNDCFMNNTN